LKALGGEASRIEGERTVAQQRLGKAQTEINNLVGVLAVGGADALGSVKDRLHELEEEKKQLKETLDRLTTEVQPHAAVEESARAFIEAWRSPAALLEEASPEDRRTILQHYVEVIQVRASEPKAKSGEYTMRLFPEARPLDPGVTGETSNPPVLTQGAEVRGLDEKAPRDEHSSKTRAAAQAREKPAGSDQSL